MARTFPPMSADERTTLVSWLDFHRETLAKKCAGLSDEQLRRQAVPPSDLSLLGLVRHLTEVEQSWFGIVFLGRSDERPYSSEAEPDGALLGDPGGLDGTVDEVFRAWHAECDEARGIVAAASLDDVAPQQRWGQEVSLRWILVHMVEEYARHNGHADLLRQTLDGTTGA